VAVASAWPYANSSVEMEQKKQQNQIKSNHTNTEDVLGSFAPLVQWFQWRIFVTEMYLTRA